MEKQKPKKNIKKKTNKAAKLTEKQKLFCIYYIKNFNATLAYLKSYGCSYDVALSNAYRMMENDGVRKEIQRLKELKKDSIMLSPEDIVERYMRIAFADMTDFVEWGRTETPVIGMYGPVMIDNPITGKKEPLMQTVNDIRFKESNVIDGGLVCQVKQGRDGVTIKLEDRQKALDWLANFFEMNPMDKHKKEYDKRKIEIDLIKAEAQLNKSGENQETPQGDDGFIDALNSSASEVWDDVGED